jgi:hypothetical protein
MKKIALKSLIEDQKKYKAIKKEIRKQYEDKLTNLKENLHIYLSELGHYCVGNVKIYFGNSDIVLGKFTDFEVTDLNNLILKGDYYLIKGFNMFENSISIAYDTDLTLSPYKLLNFKYNADLEPTIEVENFDDDEWALNETFYAEYSRILTRPDRASSGN